MKRSRLWSKILLIVVVVAGAAGVVHTLPPPPPFTEYKAQFRLTDSYLLSSDGRVINRTRTDFSKRNLFWTELQFIKTGFIDKLVEREDKRFYRHFGVDPLALISAARDSLTGRPRGASTLTMQLAKNYYRLNTRHPLGKIRQMIGAALIELRWNKQQILEAYLNSVYFRGEFQGLGTASLALFNKSPQSLTEDETLTLLSLIRNPNADKAPKELSLKKFESVELAPHYHAFLRQRTPFVSTTSIDFELQTFAISAMKHQLETLRSRNVRDSGILVLDNHNGSVLAYIGGSGTEFSSSPFVDMVQAQRQIGSTVKPFLYATALENNILKLDSWIEDSPIDIVFENGTYTPRNHDRQFHGWVHPSQALGSSLNVPAVKTVQLVGIENFWKNLKRLGFTLDHEPDHYGPSLALGTLDANLWTLTHAFQKFVFNRGDVVFSDETNLKISWMLSRPQNRALTFGLDSILNVPQGFAVKTGTSKDMKDNWCVGFNRDFTVGVWVGNSDSSSMENVLGTTGAAPIWRDIVNYLLNHRRNNTPLISFEQNLRLTELEKSEAPPRAFGTNKIVSPAPESIYAIDPAIPEKFQKIILEASGPQNDLEWKFNGKPVEGRFFTLKKGRQKIELYRAGKKMDESTFLVK